MRKSPSNTLIDLLVNMLVFGNRETILYVASEKEEAEKTFQDVKERTLNLCTGLKNIDMPIDIERAYKNQRLIKMSHGTYMRFFIAGTLGCGQGADIVVIPNKDSISENDFSVIKPILEGTAHTLSKPIIIYGGTECQT